MSVRELSALEVLLRKPADLREDETVFYDTVWRRVVFAAATRARRERFPASYRPGLNLRPACAPRKMARLGLSYVVPERTYQSTYQSPSRVEPIVPDLAILRASRT